MSVLFRAAILLGVTFPAGQSDSPVGPDADPMKVQKEARQLEIDGEYETALEKLLWCYDEGIRADPAYVGVRNSFLVGQIAKLGEKYPPALEAMRVRRDTADEEVRRSKGTRRFTMDVLALGSLNHHLGDNAANLALYDELKSEAPDLPILKLMRRYVSDELIKAGREDELNEQDDMAFSRSNLRAAKRAWPHRPEQVLDSSSVRATTAYNFDNQRYDQELAAARDESARMEVLERRWDEVVLAGTYTHVVMDQPFHRSVAYWKKNYLRTGAWTIQSDVDLMTDQAPLNGATVLVKGDCFSDLTIDGGGMVHIYGDLVSNLTVSGQSEIVIGGDLAVDGALHGDGIVHVFVGGNMRGEVLNKGSGFLWANGDVTGSIGAGRPSARVHVMGNFTGEIRPTMGANMLSLDVRGSMSSDLVQSIARLRWTDFKASIGTSDAAPGLYPKGLAVNARWVIHSQH